MYQSMKEYWDHRAANYDTLFDRSPVRIQIMNRIKSETPPYVESILDLGAGTGRLTEHLITQYPKATFHLVDLSGRMLDQAKSRLESNENIVFHETSFERLPIPTHSIDLVVSAFALHHVDDRGKARAAREVRRVLRVGGTAIIADEMIFDQRIYGDRVSLNRRMLEVFYPSEDDDFFDRTFSDLEEWPTTPRNLEKIFRDAGLRCSVEMVNDIVGILRAN